MNQIFLSINNPKKRALLTSIEYYKKPPPHLPPHKNIKKKTNKKICQGPKILWLNWIIYFTYPQPCPNSPVVIWVILWVWHSRSCWSKNTYNILIERWNNLYMHVSLTLVNSLVNSSETSTVISAGITRGSSHWREEKRKCKVKEQAKLDRQTQDLRIETLNKIWEVTFMKKKVPYT